MLTMQDAETGEQVFVDTHDARFSQALRGRRGQARGGAARRRSCDAGVDTLELSTADDLADAILRFGDLRKQRSRLAAGGGLPQHLG